MPKTLGVGLPHVDRPVCPCPQQGWMLCLSISNWALDSPILPTAGRGQRQGRRILHTEFTAELLEALLLEMVTSYPPGSLSRAHERMTRLNFQPYQFVGKGPSGAIFRKQSSQGPLTRHKDPHSMVSPAAMTTKHLNETVNRQ